MAAEGGLPGAQFDYGQLLSDGRVQSEDGRTAAYYFKSAADQGMLEGQLRYSECLRDGCGVSMNIDESERYLEQAASGGTERAVLQYGIALACGGFGRFDFEKASVQFRRISESNRIAREFVDSISKSDDLVPATSIRQSGSIFGLFRDKYDRSPIIRRMNPELSETEVSSAAQLKVWIDFCRSAFPSLIDVSQLQSTALSTFPTDLISCTSISAIIPILFRLYSIQSALYFNINHFLRKFPINLIRKFMKELGGVLSYIYLLQSSIEQWSLLHPLRSDCIVHRGFHSDGPSQAVLYESMAGEVIVFGGFVSASQNRDRVISKFVRSGAGLLFEIALPAGAVAALIAEYSDYPDEAEVMIPASTGFVVDSVEWIIVWNPETQETFEVGLVRLSYFVSWRDFDIDDGPPVMIL
jgi:hypothetical protein